ncbi:MAG: Ig-like domain-containing protein [Thermoguttaceae bacterium]|nr:Ig-like domain-containing protein [Thermoguttaceae bacterium]
MPALAVSSDSGTIGDGITSITQPAFVGTAEANAKVRVFVRIAGGGDNNDLVLVGEAFANSDESDGDPTNGLGLWEITVEPLADGTYEVFTEVEDLAGNISPSLEAPLVITIDTVGPQRPTIDLADSDDTGASDLDNVTIGDPDALPQTRVADFRISAELGSAVVVKDGQIVIAEFVFDNDFDMTDGVLDGFGILRIDFVANEATFGIPAEGPHPLSAEAFDAAGNYTQSEQLLVTIDTTPPAAPTITLLEGSDTLPLGDGITSNNEPAFQGAAEANSLVRLFANGELVGMAIAGSDESDGDLTNGLGVWEITAEPLNDDDYVFVATAEDLAGNVSPPSEDLPLTVAEFYGFFVDPVTGALIVHGEAGEADLFEVSLDAAGTMVDVDWTSAGSGTVSISLPLATTPSVTFYGYGGDDTLVVDNSRGLVTLSDGIYFHGAAGFDVIRLVGDTAIDTSIYGVGPTVDAGRITHQTGESLQVVTFTGLEPVIDAVQAALLTVNATNADNAIAISDSLTPGFGRVTLDGFELVEFAAKAALQVNSLGGNDTIDVRATSSLVPTTIDAGAPTASDRVIVNGTAAADAIAVTPTGADSATVQVGAFSPITIVHVESLAINGLGGGDRLTVNLPATAGDRAIYEPGSGVDEGVVRVLQGAAGASLLPAEFANLGAAGSVVLHDGGGDGQLFYIGTPLDDTLHVANVAPAANQVAHARYLPVVTEGFDTLRLNMLAGADSIIVAAEADYATIEYGSGEPDTGDNVVLSNVLPTDYVVRHSAAGKTTVAAQATTHVLSGIESFAIIAGAAAGGDNLTVIGDSTVDDKLIVSPLAGTSIQTGGPGEAASFRFDGSNLQFRFESLDGVFLYQGGESADLHLGDQLVVQTSSSHDVAVVDAPNRTVSAENAAGTLLKTVTLDADVEVLTVETGLGNDTVLVIPAVQVGELAPGFGPDNLLINIDGGPPAASDALVIAADASQPIPAALPESDFVVVKHGLKAGEGVVRVFRNAVAMPDITYTNIEVVSPVVTPDPATGDTPLLILGPDAYEQNEHRANAAYLGSGAVINVTDLAIFPGYGEHRFVVADEDYYRVVAQTTGVLDFQVFFRGFNATELPAGGNLDIYVLDADGTVIAGDGPLFGVNDGAGDFIDAAGRDNDERIRIPVVAGQTYYLHVTGAGGATSGIVNGYDLTIVNTAVPQPYALELDDTPPGDDTIGDAPANSDTGRSEFDDVTRDNTPVIFFRLDDGILLHDLPGNAAADSPPDEVIPIPFNPERTAATSTPGFRVAIFDEGENGGQQVGAAPQTPIGYARQYVSDGAVVEGVYVFDFDTDALDPAFTLDDGSHFLSARVQMIDPATPAQTGWGPRSALLEIVVDTAEPPVSFGFPDVAGDGLQQAGDTGIPNQPATYVDRITSNTTPTFWGIAEANAVVRVYADLNNNGVLDPATDLLLGKTVALPTDGTSQHPDGQWTLTSPINLNDPAYFPVLDRTRTLFVTAEDLAGNVSGPDSEDMLRIFLDTRGPQISDIGILGDNYDLFDPKPSTDGPTPLVLGLDIDFVDRPLRNAQFVYPAVNPILATTPGNYILVGDANGIIPIKSIELIDTTVAGELGRTTIRLHFFAALPDDRYTLTVSDRIADNAGNALDGESHAREPLETVLFPSGDGVPGGDFAARFTIDSRPEVATYAAGSVWVDTNGNGVFDPTNADRTNRDIVYTFGFTSDDLFVGNFVAGVNARADGFDKLAAYGNVGGQFRWMIDVDNDGVPDLNVPEPAQVNGLPVAGRFDGNNTNGDEVGLYSAGTTNGSTWYFDTNHDFQVDYSLKSQLHGVPFVGDFDGDGYDDLATWQDDTFQFDLANGVLRGWDGIVDDSVTFRFGFIGVRERPVAADLDGDGYDDIGLWVPDRSGVAPIESSEWYILVSNGTTLFNRIVTDPDLGVPTIDFKPEPFGPDQFVQFGDGYAMPLLGNFDPPVAGTTASDPAVFEITGTGADDVFEFQASADGKIGSVVLNGVVQTIPAGVTSIVFDGGGGYDTASLRGSSGDEVFIASPGSATLSGAGFSVTTRATEVNHGYGMGGNDEATLYDTAGNDKFKAKPAENYAKMYNGSYMNRAKFFSTVVGIFDEGNDDYARIWDSAGDDVLNASPTEARLVGESIDIRVLAANRLLAYSTAGGNDTANLYDSPGNDVMRARSHKTVFSGPGFDMTLRQWQTIHAFAENGGYDVAKLHDTSGNDVVRTAEDWGSLSVDQPGGRLLYDALGFDVVKAYHSKGNDKAPDPDVVDFLMLDGDWDTD